MRCIEKQKTLFRLAQYKLKKKTTRQQWQSQIDLWTVHQQSNLHHTYTHTPQQDR